MSDIGVTLDDVRALALSLPETTEKLAWGNPTWRVKDHMFVWDRPLRKTDLAELGDAAPQGTILGCRVEDLGEKEALLAADPDVLFTITHLDGHASVLVPLDLIDAARLRELVVDAWLARAPEKLARAFLANQG